MMDSLKLARTLVIDFDDSLTDATNVDFVPADRGAGWLWLVIRIVIALVAPAAFILSIWFVGPFLRGIITGVIQSPL